jgi:hypothetical protein
MPYVSAALLLLVTLAIAAGLRLDDHELAG